MKYKVINKEFTKLLGATFITRFGDSIDTIAFSWMVYIMTGSRVLMGSIFIVSVLPNLIILPFGGVLADAYNKKTITVLGDVFRGFTVAALALLYAIDLLAVWHLFVFAIINSILESFANPARGSMMQSLIQSDEYVKGASYQNSVSQFGTLVGLAVAGVLISVIDIWGTILVDGITFFISAILIYSMKFTDLRNNTLDVKTVRKFLNPIIEGFKYMKSKRLLFIVILLASFINFAFVPYNVLRPIYVSEVLNIGVQGLSYMGMAIFLGMIVGGLWMGKKGTKIKPINAISFGMVMMGLMYILLGVVEYLLLPFTFQIAYAIVVTFLLGFFLPIINAPISAIVMKTTAPEMIGRLSSIMGVLALCAMPLGGALVSFIGDRLSVTILFIIMGLSASLVSSLFWLGNHHTSLE